MSAQMQQVVQDAEDDTMVDEYSVRVVLVARTVSLFFSAHSKEE
jgi:hypothetical protein